MWDQDKIYMDYINKINSEAANIVLTLGLTSSFINCYEKTMQFYDNFYVCRYKIFIQFLFVKIKVISVNYLMKFTNAQWQ